MNVLDLSGRRKGFYLLLAVFLLLPTVRAQPPVLNSFVDAKIGAGWHEIYQNPENDRTYRWMGEEGLINLDNKRGPLVAEVYFYVKAGEEPQQLKINYQNTTVYQRTIYPFWESHYLKINIPQGRSKLKFSQEDVCDSCQTLIFENITLKPIKEVSKGTNFFNKLDTFFFSHGIAPAFFYINLFLVSALVIYLLANNFRRQFWVICLLILLIAVSARLLYPAMHLMYTDEHLNMEAASNYLDKGRPYICSYSDVPNSCRIYQKPVAYSLLLAIVFAIFGASSTAAISFSLLLGSLIPFFLFLAIYKFTDAVRLSFIAAFISAVLPSQIIWSNTAETNISSLLFFSILLFALSLYRQKQNYTNAIFLISSSTLAMQFRPELSVIVPLVLLVYYAVYRSELNLKKYLLPLSMGFFLVIPHLSHLIANFSYYTHFLVFEQIKSEWLQIFQPTSLELVMAPLSLLIFLFGFRNLWQSSQQFTKFYTVITALFLASEPFLVKTLARSSIYPIFFVSLFLASSLDFFFAPRYQNFMRERLTGLTMGKKRFEIGLLIIILTLAFLSGVFLARDRRSQSVTEQARLQTSVPAKMEKEIRNCTIVTERPELIQATTDLQVISNQRLLNNPDLLNSDRCYLFYEGINCHINFSKYFKHRCQAIKNNFADRKYQEYRLGNTSYTLYHLSPKAEN